MRRFWFISIFFAIIIMVPTGVADQATFPTLLVISEDEPETADRIYGQDLSREVYNAVSENRYKNFIIKLTENGSRVVGSLNNVYAKEWIADQLAELSSGRIEVEILGNHNSVVGRLPGWLPGEAPVLMIGGHYDSVDGAPGANDDGTGVAATLELAYVMSQYSWPLDIYFCAWNAEEVGLIGSGEVASIFAQRGIDILIYYNIDMLLVEDPEAPPDERVLFVYNNGAGSTYHDSHLFADLGRMMSRNIGLNLIRPYPSTEFGVWYRSDHASFLTQGYESVLFAFESGLAYDDAYHQPSDTWDNPAYNYNLTKDTVASIGASMAWVMGRSYGEMTTIEISGRTIPESSIDCCFLVTTETEISVQVGWDGLGLNLTMIGPNHQIVDHASMFASSSTAIDLFTTEVSINGLYRILIEPLDGNVAIYDMKITYSSDIDGNGVEDHEEYWFTGDLFDVDHDADGLSDGMEIILGTSQWSRDSDEDNTPDGWEYENGLNPLVPDSHLDPDNDTLSNLKEYEIGTSPRNNDTDSDSIDDGFEVLHGLNPLVDDSQLDPDLDGYSNLEEYRLGLDPNVFDINYTLATIGLGGVGGAIMVGIFVKRRR